MHGNRREKRAYHRLGGVIGDQQAPAGPNPPAGPGGACKGGADTMEPENTVYQSSDDKHWTATYPCLDGGSTTVPVPLRSVPGAGS